VIQQQKTRSAKWISSSIPENRWDTELAKTFSAEYMTNNLRSPVYFQEASLHIPSNAIVIEIGPYGTLQGVLRGSLGPEVTNISLAGDKSSLIPLLQSLGQSAFLTIS
jgi:fatty acid synthase, animal type